MPKHKYAVILAGGNGSRAGGEMPKQFVELLGIPILWWSVRAFHAADPDTHIVIVMNPSFWDDWDIIYNELPEEDRRIPLQLFCGGRSRTESVWNGIMDLPHDADTLIAVHDAARPLITKGMVAELWKTAEDKGSAVPCVEEVNSLRVKDGGDTRPVDRADFLVVQTPQVFRADILHDAYVKHDPEAKFTDDASLVQQAGYDITVAPGIPDNIKVTNPMDFAVAEAIMRYQADKKQD